MPQFDAFEDLVGQWRWRLLGADGRTVATSGESYDSHWHALRAAENARGVGDRRPDLRRPGRGSCRPTWHDHRPRAGLELTLRAKERC